jgi:hypothetical protein
MIKDINVVQIWNEGKIYNCDKYQCNGVGDNYIDGTSGVANNYYALGVTIFDELGVVSGINWVITGNVAMTGEAYANWDGSNDAVVNWVAEQLGLTYSTPGTIRAQSLNVSPVLTK